MNVLDRFLTYVAYWTTSDDASLESPSTARQKTLGHLLVDEMQALGLQDVTMDAAGNVIGTGCGVREKASGRREARPCRNAGPRGGGRAAADGR